MPFSLRKLLSLGAIHAAPTDWLVVGIGNPGDRYRNTRHNAGWDGLDEFVRSGQIVKAKNSGVRTIAKVEHVVWDSKLVVAAKPATFVNASGRAVVNLLRHYHLKPQRLLVLCDDIHLDPGRVRIRPAGGAGGHNGLKSVINALGSDQFARIRIGVGQPPSPATQVEHVLARPPAAERRLLRVGIERCALMVQSVIKAGVEQTMNDFNSST